MSTTQHWQHRLIIHWSNPSHSALCPTLCFSFEFSWSAKPYIDLITLHHCSMTQYCQGFSFREVAYPSAHNFTWAIVSKETAGKMPSHPTAAHSTFWFGRTNVMILFPGWPDHTLSHFYLALFVAFMLALLADFYALSSAFEPKLAPKRLLSHTTTYCLRMYLTYLVILSVVTFNVGVFLAVIAGHVIGYLAVMAFILYWHPTATVLIYNQHPTAVNNKVWRGHQVLYSLFMWVLVSCLVCSCVISKYEWWPDRRGPYCHHRADTRVTVSSCTFMVEWGM